MSVETDSLLGANFSAFSAVSLGSAATVASSIALLNANTSVKVAQFAAASFLGVVLTTSAATAWIDSSTRNAKSYWKNFALHSCVGVPAMAALVAHSLFNAVISGIAKSVEDRVFSVLSNRSYRKM